MSRNQRLLVRAVVGGIAVIVFLNVLGYVLDRASGAREGPASSSYTTSPSGLAGYADLLSGAGHRIVRLRTTLAEEAPPSDATVVMLDAGNVGNDEARALSSFVESGGRLIAGGRGSPGWLAQVVLTRPEWSPGKVGSAGVASPAAEVDGIQEVRAGGEGYWSSPGSTLPVLSEEGDVLATVETVGEGRVVLLADSSVLHNALLDEADNAAFGLQAAGAASRPVLFVESVHGYSAQEGALSAVPERWLWALGGLLLATLVYMVARGRRLGPPEEPHRELPPPRLAYVDALGGILARTRDAPAIGTRLQRELRARLAGRTGAGDEESLTRAAVGAGLTPEEARLLWEPVQSEEDLLTLGRAVSSLERKRTS
ncbi:MAG: DUF4350 domain-containing protein [Actinomycetota bacterium]|nr:DUF4350 domain-containing protein [Actinomycetota bacterium]